MHTLSTIRESFVNHQLYYMHDSTAEKCSAMDWWQLISYILHVYKNDEYSKPKVFPVFTEQEANLLNLNRIGHKNKHRICVCVIRYISTYFILIASKVSLGQTDTIFIDILTWIEPINLCVVQKKKSKMSKPQN